MADRETGGSGDTQVAPPPAQDTAPPAAATRTAAPMAPAAWHPATRIAFRFGLVYFGLFILLTPVFTWSIVSPGEPGPTLVQLPPIPQVVSWVGTALLGFESVSAAETGSGDRPFDYALTFALLLIAMLAAAGWTAYDRGRRLAHVALHGWFLLVLRFALGAALVTYGMFKVFPLQMPFPSLAAMLQPFGHFSPMGLLWSVMGASPAYQGFTGAMELLAGVMLLTPRLHRVGALLALGTTLHVLVLNLTYDVPVKLFSLHLVVMSLVLLAPDSGRLLDVLVLGRPTESEPRRELVRGSRARRLVLVGQLALAAWIVGTNLVFCLRLWTDPPPWFERTVHAAQHPLYGIWEVEVMSIDGRERPPLLTDTDRWRRVVIQGHTLAAVQHMNDALTWYPTSLNVEDSVIELGAEGEAGYGRFAYERTGDDRLVLEGEVAGRPNRLELRLMDMDRFLLLERPFRWVQEAPFSR